MVNAGKYLLLLENIDSKSIKTLENRAYFEYLNGRYKEAAKLYGVTQEIIDRKPSAGLFEGQTDENEMGVTYDELDSFLLGGKINEDKERRILHLHKVSEHKRNPIPRPNNFERE